MSRIINTESFIIHETNIKGKSQCTPVVAIATTTLILASTLSSISFKSQGNYGFKHGVVQSVMMFVGEWVNLLIFGGTLITNRTRLRKHMIDLKAEAGDQKLDLKFTKIWMALPCLLDCIGSTMSLFSLMLMPPSLNVMMNGASIIFITIVSRIMLKTPIYKHNALGCFFALLGFIIVGLSALVGGSNNDSKYPTSNIIFGIILTLCFLVILSIQANTEELILRRKAIHVQRMIGLEGQFGLIWAFMICMIFSFVPCLHPGLCNMEGYFEDIIGATREILTQPGLAAWCLSAAVAVLLLNLCGLILVKHVSAVFKSFWGSLNIISIWITSILLGLEEFHLIPSLIQLFGFVFLIIGNFTYNEVIEWKFWGINKNMRKYRNPTEETMTETDKIMSLEDREDRRRQDDDIYGDHN